MVNLSTGLTALTSSSFVLSSFKCIYSVVFSKLKQSQIQAWWKGNRGPFLYTLPQDLPLHSMTKTNRVKRKEQNSCWLARKGNDIIMICTNCLKYNVQCPHYGIWTVYQNNLQSAKQANTFLLF